MNFRERQVLTMWAGAGIILAVLAIGWTGYMALDVVKGWF